MKKNTKEREREKEQLDTYIIQISTNLYVLVLTKNYPNSPGRTQIYILYKMAAEGSRLRCLNGVKENCW
jgi:hypothetical protein